jgi:hypothetical protein
MPLPVCQIIKQFRGRLLRRGQCARTFFYGVVLRAPTADVAKVETGERRKAGGRLLLSISKRIIGFIGFPRRLWVKRGSLMKDILWIQLRE